MEIIFIKLKVAIISTWRYGTIRRLIWDGQ